MTDTDGKNSKDTPVEPGPMEDGHLEAEGAPDGAASVQADSSASSAIPEIEAEVVSEQITGSETGTLFDHQETAGEVSSAAADHSNPAPAKSTIKWVLPIAVIALMGAAGGAWYFTKGGQPGTASLPAQTSTPASPQTTADIPETSQDPAPTEQAEDQPKIANIPPTDIKAQTTQAEITPEPLSDEVAKDLPPGEEIENTALLADAKEAIAAAQDEAVEDISGETGENATSTLTDNTQEIAETDSTLTDDPEPASANAVATEGTSTNDTLSSDPSLENLPPSAADEQPDTQPLAEETSPSPAPAEAIDIAESVAEATTTTAPPPIDTAMAEQVTALETALADETGRADMLAAKLTALQSQHDEALEQIEQANTRHIQAQQQIAALKAENRTLSAKADQAPPATGALALNDITRALATGEPFNGALQSLNDAAPDAPQIALLSPYADGSAPLMAEIQRSLGDAIRAGLSAARKSEAKSTMERYSARIANMINLRPSTPQPGATPEAIVSRIEFAVENGDLKDAINEVHGLPADAQAAMQDWVELAQKRIAIEEALASLNASIARDANG